MTALENTRENFIILRMLCDYYEKSKIFTVVWKVRSFCSVEHSNVITGSTAQQKKKKKKSTVIFLVAIKCNATLDADLQSSRVTSRGLFKENNERYMQRDVMVTHSMNCVQDIFNVQVSAIVRSFVTKMIRRRYCTELNEFYVCKMNCITEL